MKTSGAHPKPNFRRRIDWDGPQELKLKPWPSFRPIHAKVNVFVSTARATSQERDSVSLLSDFTEKEDSNPVLAKTSFPTVPVTHTLLTQDTCTRVNGNPHKGHGGNDRYFDRGGSGVG